MASEDYGLRTINGSDFEDARDLCDVVVVHGLYGSNHSSWIDIKWEDEFLPSLRGESIRPRLSLYTYDVFGPLGGILTLGGAKDEATRLLDSLLKIRDDRSKNMPIVFVGHDLGGSLVKEAAILAQQRKYKDVYTSIGSMVFLGCPHQGLKVDLQAGCTHLLMTHQKTTYPEAWDLSGPLVDWVQATNYSFAETRIPTIISIILGVSTHPDSKERVFDRFATSTLSMFDKWFITDLGHKDLLRDMISKGLGGGVEWTDFSSNAAFRQCVDKLASQAPPQYSIDTLPLDKEEPEISAARRAFLEFINSDGAGCWLVHVPFPGYGAVETAEHIFRWRRDLSEQKLWTGLCEFFSFDPNNGHRDSAEAALYSFLAQLYSHRFHLENEKEEHTQEIIKYLDICHNTQIQDLYFTWISIVLLTLKSRRKDPSNRPEFAIVIILGNLDDRIKDGAWLFQKLESIVHDCGLRLKVVITSSDPASLVSPVRSATLAGSSGLKPVDIYKLERPARPGNKVKVRNSHDSVSETRDQVEDATFLKSIIALVQDRPQLYGYSVALGLLAQSCGNDETLWELLANWLRGLQFPSEEQLQEAISQLIPATPQKVFKHILTSLPSQTRSWSSLVLEWVTFAFRPLTLGELLDLELLDLSEEPQHGLPGVSALRRITEKACGGLLTVRRKEIHLAHSELRDFLLASTQQAPGSPFSFSSAASTHERIATACLNYLASPKRRQLLEHRAGAGSWHTPFECKDDLLSYAVKYWLRHAMSAGKEIFASNAWTRFLADDEVVRLWVVLYQGLSPPTASRGDKSIVNIFASLAIFAEHEAEDLLISSLKKYQELKTAGLSNACFAALAVAAGRGNLRIVKELLAIPLPEGETLDQPILAAIESGNKEVFSEIIDLEQNIRRGIQDFTPLLARAASLGHTAFAKTLLDMAKTSGRDIGTSRGLSSLSYACQRGNSEVLEWLIREGGPTVMSELEVGDHTPLPIRLAIQFGDIDILDILRSAIAERADDSAAIRYYRSVFTESSAFSRRRPVQNILDYLDRHLRREISTPSDRTDSTEVGEEDIMISYLHNKVVHDGYSSTSPGAAITKAIQQWPHAIDLLDILTGPKRSILKDPQFPSYFEAWMEAAVSNGDIAVVKLLFENGARSQWAIPQVLEHVTTVGFRTALIDQFARGMKYLIDKGASFTSYSSLYDMTPLSDAASQGLSVAVRALIETGVDVNEKGDSTWFPIHFGYHNVKITRQLIAAGADIDVLSTPENSKGQPSLYYAVGWDYPSVVDELLKAKPSRKTLQSSMGVAVERQAYMIEKLLPHCPDASYLPDTDRLLHLQVRDSSLKNIQVLLGHQYQLDIHKVDGDGNTALHYISASTSAEVVELLIEHGANIEAVNNEDLTPLSVATKARNNSAVQCLVEHGALINTAAGSLDGPFILACGHGTLDMVKMMHTNKADPAIVNHLNPTSLDGTALNAALFRSKETDEKQAIIQYLLKEGNAEVNTLTMFWGGALPVACLTSTIETMRLLIEQYHANVNAKDNTGRTPLHIALYRTRAHVELLLKHGADIDAVDIIQRTALHFAVLSGRLDVVKLVLDKRPKFINQKDAHGWTPLLWALRVTGLWGTQTSEMQAIVQELLDRGAYRLVRGEGIDRTWTPMTIAKYYRVSEEITPLLTPRPEDFEKMGDDDRNWDWKSGGSKKAVFDTGEMWCDHCLLGLHGQWYSCAGKGCDGRTTAYCLHCYQSRSKLHRHEVFKITGEEEDDSSDAGGDSQSDGPDSEPETESDEQPEVEDEDAEEGEDEDEREDDDEDESE
ncbi:hypothetical protein F5Y14DRAFT_23861 [Nemania sp. NC0429]|nr:hypothetical protein F5Y14DRAFT_23861 [Nemania sp. NC0429]